MTYKTNDHTAVEMNGVLSNDERVKLDSVSTSCVVQIVYIDTVRKWNEAQFSDIEAEVYRRVNPLYHGDLLKPVERWGNGAFGSMSHWAVRAGIVQTDGRGKHTLTPNADDRIAGYDKFENSDEILNIVNKLDSASEANAQKEKIDRLNDRIENLEEELNKYKALVAKMRNMLDV